MLQAMNMSPEQQDCRWIAGALGPVSDDYDADIIILALDRAEETLAAIHSALRRRTSRCNVRAGPGIGSGDADRFWRSMRTAATSRCWRRTEPRRSGWPQSDLRALVMAG